MGGYKHFFSFLILAFSVCLNLYSQIVKDLDDYKSLGRDSIIGCAKHELLFRYKKSGLNINCYSRVEVLAGIEDGKEALYVNFDNPIRFRELVNPDRIGINLLSGLSYYSSRGNIEVFYCSTGNTMMKDFLNCLENSQTDGSLFVLPGTQSPSSSYLEVIDYGDHYGFTMVFGASSIDYQLRKADCRLTETGRNTIDQSETLKPYLEEIK
jgi:hypothetical protein